MRLTSSDCQTMWLTVKNLRCSDLLGLGLSLDVRHLVLDLGLDLWFDLDRWTHACDLRRDGLLVVRRGLGLLLVVGLTMRDDRINQLYQLGRRGGCTHLQHQVASGILSLDLDLGWLNLGVSRVNRVYRGERPGSNAQRSNLGGGRREGWRGRSGSLRRWRTRRADGRASGTSIRKHRCQRRTILRRTRSDS
jgi:hypothetical protein